MSAVEKYEDLVASISRILGRGVSFSENLKFEKKLRLLDVEEQVPFYREMLKKHFGTENPDDIDYDTLPIHPESLEAYIIKHGKLPPKT